MENIKSYNDLLESIKIAKKILDNCNNSLHEIELFYKKHTRKGYPVSSSGQSSYVDADTIYGSKSELRYDQLADMVEEQSQFESMKFLQEGIIERLNRTKEEVENNLSNMEGIKQKVFYMHIVKGIQLKDIAKELKYSEIHIKRINSKL